MSKYIEAIKELWFIFVFKATFATAGILFVSSGETFLIIFGVVLLALAGFMVFIFVSAFPSSVKSIEKRKKSEENFIKDHPHYVEEQFYQQCVNEGYTSLKTKEEIARFMLHMKKKGIVGTEEELIARYNLGCEETKKSEKREKELAKAEARETKEKEIALANKKYFNLYGIEKYKAVCKDEIKKLKDELKMLEFQYSAKISSAERNYNLMKTRENDWALLGGIATGIAGGAAGAVTAINAEAENIEIRANNQNLLTAMATVSLSETSDLTAEMSKLERKIENFKATENKLDEVLIENINAKELEKHLDCKTVKKDRVGNTVIAKVSITPEEFHIYDTVKAYVDGTMTLILKDDEKVLGSATFCLPNFGVTKKTTIEVFIDNCEEGTITKTEFKPDVLWAVEKI